MAAAPILTSKMAAAVLVRPAELPHDILDRILAYADDKKAACKLREMCRLLDERRQLIDAPASTGVKKQAPQSSIGSTAAAAAALRSRAGGGVIPIPIEALPRRSYAAFSYSNAIIDPPDLTAEFGSASIVAQSPDSRLAEALAASAGRPKQSGIGKAKKKTEKASKKPVATADDYKTVKIEEFKSDGSYVRRWVRSKMIGIGGFGKVYKCRTLKGVIRNDGRAYALKVVSKANRNSHTMQMVRKLRIVSFSTSTTFYCH